MVRATLLASVLAGVFSLSGWGASISPSPKPSPVLTEFRDEIERDFALKTTGQLQITNMRGDILIQGWSLDKIRIKARRRAVAASEEEAKRLFSAVDFRFRASDGLIELGAEYGRGLSLEERLRERSEPRTGMEMVVYAPANLKLRVWGVDGKITIKGWNKHVDVRASTGQIQVENVRSGGVSVLCPGCEMRIRSVRGPVRCMGGSGAIELASIESPQTYVETDIGAVSASYVRGEQLYVTKEGAITGRELNGRIEFHGQSGPVEIVESVGFLSGRTTSGGITARMRDWSFADKAVIESIQGDIRLSLPSTFSGDVELSSGKGNAEIGFPVVRTDERASSASIGSSPRRISGRVGEGGELLKIFSAQGSIQVIKGG